MSHSKQYMQPPSGACVTVLLLCLPTLLLFPSPAFTQTPNELDKLIFEPVLIDSATGLEQASPSLPLQFLPQDDATGSEPLASPEMPVQEEPTPLEVMRSIDAYRESVDALEAENGPFSPDLPETLIDLASQYQLARDHEAAIEVLQRAEHINRVNYGLYHPEQYVSIKMMIESYMAMGDLAKANQKQRYLVYLNEQHYGPADPNTLPALVNLAKHNMENFNRVLTGPVEPTISFSSNVGFGPSSRDPTPKEMAFGNLFMAQQSYQQAIATMIRNRQFFDPLLLALEYSFLETLLLQSFRSAILEDSDYYLSDRRNSTGSLIKYDYYRSSSNGYSNGKDAFERILIYIRNNPEAKVYQLVNALMEYGDWNMLFGKTQSALDKYREAYALTQELDVEQQSVEQMFRPDLPVHLPLITAKPNSREKFGIPSGQDLAYEGYIDIAFTISRFGRAKHIDILASSGNVSKEIERRLQRFLRNSPFRPRLEEDNSFESTRVTLRYYFTFADQMLVASN